MVVSEDNVFLPIPKCASRSIMSWMGLYGGVHVGNHQHDIVEDHFYYRNRFIFTVVRNPYARAVSIWKHLRDGYEYKKPIENLMESFVQNDLTDIKKPMLVANQYHYLNWAFENLQFTYIKLENLNDEVISLPFYNEEILPKIDGASSSNTLQEVEELNDDAISWINCWANEDFINFDYPRTMPSCMNP